jgi:ParB-like chromosome segregation protein Spo0J
MRGSTAIEIAVDHRFAEAVRSAEPILVDADGIILAGNGTYAGAIELGWKFIAVVRSHLRGAEARAYAIADNRTGELAEWDVDELTATLDELSEAGIGADLLEFNDADIDALIESAERDGETERRRDEASGGGKGGGELKAQWKIVIDCQDETDQAAMLDRLTSEGRKCRALTA